MDVNYLISVLSGTVSVGITWESKTWGGYLTGTIKGKELFCFVLFFRLGRDG